ncbi:MAG TPA: hypothetical protein VIP77_25800 [Jiangellaceae bacterium]
MFAQFLDRAGDRVDDALAGTLERTPSVFADPCDVGVEGCRGRA